MHLGYASCPRAQGSDSTGRRARMMIPCPAGGGALQGPFSSCRHKRVCQYTREISKELRETPGFIGITTAIVGHRLFTTTAWEDLDNPRPIFESKAHREAVAAFFGAELGSGGQTGVWVPHRLNAMWVRCASCGRMADYEKGAGICDCGQPLPDAAA